MNKYKVLLYYKYHPIKDPKKFAKEHKEFCENHHLVGRILIGGEGLNGTCAGTKKKVDAYKKYVHSLPGFEDVWFKEQDIDDLPLQKLVVKVRDEVVTLGVKKVDPKKGGNYVTPLEFNKLIEQENDSIIFFDVRNQIESTVGHFEGALTPQIRFFRELPKEISKHEKLKDKKVVLYCTGGIRCEKASALFKKEGFKDVHQLEGGIYNYCSQFPEGHFKGTCFVFDDRMQITFDHSGVLSGDKIPEEKIISTCEFCGGKSGRVVNDERKAVRYLLVCCEACDTTLDVSRVRYGEEKKELLGINPSSSLY